MIVDLPTATVSRTLSRNNKRGLNRPIHNTPRTPDAIWHSHTIRKPTRVRDRRRRHHHRYAPFARYLATIWMELTYRII